MSITPVHAGAAGTAHAAATGRSGAPLSRPRLLLLLLGAVGALLALAGCGTVDNTTEIAADGSGTQTLEVRISAQDMEDVDGGAATIEAVIEANNPGLEYQGMTTDGTDTVFTLSLSFTDAQDYAAQAQTVMDAGGLSRTAEVTFTPPSPPFSSGYTVTRNFTGNDLTRWAVKALVDDGKIANAEEGDIDSALEQGEVTIAVDGEQLEQTEYSYDGSAATWTNADTVSFESVDVVTAGIDDPSADSYTRTLTYELPRETYLDATADFDAFFAAATPEGGELTEPGKTGTTWVIAFPAGTAEQVATWTDTALATTGTIFAVESAPNADDPFAIDTSVISAIDCPVACGPWGVSQSAELPAGFTGTDGGGDADGASGSTELVALDGGPEPQIITRIIRFSEATYDLTVNRKGGGTMTIALTLATADEAIVTEENVRPILGGEPERTEGEGTVTYTLTADADTAEEFPDALQQIGLVGDEEPPYVYVEELDGGYYTVELLMGFGGRASQNLPAEGTWTIRGKGMAITGVRADEIGNASLAGDTVTAQGPHGIMLRLSAERTGLSTTTIVILLVALAIVGLLVAAGVLGIVHRQKIADLLRGSAQGPHAGSGL